MDTLNSPAERACAYIAERVRRASGPRWLQGSRSPALPCEGAPPAVRLFAEKRLRRVPSAAAQALVAWARGERAVDLLLHVPTPRDVLALQARGRRCVSLLDDDALAAPHEDGLAFALHDLCHLEKLADPEHHEAQVGFFALVHGALGAPGWAELEAPLDSAWASDRDHVIADMNGSAVFLLLALKSKLKVAVRRSVARARGEARPGFGALDAEEQRVWDGALEALLGLLDLRGAVGDAARSLSEKGGAPEAEVVLHRHLRALGASVVARGS
jgi:hypothetical protein